MTSDLFPISQAGYERLRRRWFDLVAPFGAADEIIQMAFAVLVSSYAEKHRRYHNLSHVLALIDKLEEEAPDPRDYPVIAFSIWFHDAVYNPYRKDNEDKSAELAERWLKELKVAGEISEQARVFVLATKAHDLLVDSDALKLFLDLDLSILGASPDVYRAYQTAIRAEYRWVPGPLYRKGRRQVLTALLAREPLYYTPAPRTRWERQARANVAAELETL